MFLDLGLPRGQICAVVQTPLLPSRRPRARANDERVRGRVQIVFWNLPASNALEDAIRALVDKTPAASGAWRCRVSLSRADRPRVARATAIFLAEVHLSTLAAGAAPGPQRLLDGWRIVVRSHGDDPLQAVRSAFRAAARVLRSGHFRPQRDRDPFAASVELRSQPETPRLDSGRGRPSRSGRA
jgi:hypothetical protein